MVNHFYNQLITRKHTSKNTTDNVSSTLFSDFVPEVPVVLDVNIIIQSDKSLVLGQAATISQ